MKKLAMLALLLPSLCFSQANINIYGFWKSSAFDIMLKNNRHLEIIIKGRSKAVIKGRWDASEKYLYLEYFAIRINSIEHEYYKTIIYEIVKLDKVFLMLRNPYTLKTISLIK